MTGECPSLKVDRRFDEEGSSKASNHFPLPFQAALCSNARVTMVMVSVLDMQKTSVNAEIADSKFPRFSFGFTIRSTVHKLDASQAIGPTAPPHTSHSQQPNNHTTSAYDACTTIHGGVRAERVDTNLMRAALRVSWVVLMTVPSGRWNATSVHSKPKRPVVIRVNGRVPSPKIGAAGFKDRRGVGKISRQSQSDNEGTEEYMGKPSRASHGRRFLNGFVLLAGPTSYKIEEFEALLSMCQGRFELPTGTPANFAESYLRDPNHATSPTSSPTHRASGRRPCRFLTVLSLERSEMMSTNGFPENWGLGATAVGTTLLPYSGISPPSPVASDMRGEGPSTSGFVLLE
ncbi:hypothetical protein B0H16DRAFT_1701090 [Mycena metata]|uniref:Uncharacterized protein n=1 Tax=Mycena metata TaxID=1033252 RepID=A0AAD7MH32_9AGAR|nr:hypothetical protein B0H16DRAFT_1701090 [Mycena metata]